MTKLRVIPFPAAEAAVFPHELRHWRAGVDPKDRGAFRLGRVRPEIEDAAMRLAWLMESYVGN